MTDIKLREKLAAAEECLNVLGINLQSYFNGGFDVKYVPCKCGKEMHPKDAVYCGMCGEKLEDVT